MLKGLTVLSFALLLNACSGDETIRAYGAGDDVWQLTALDGAPYKAHATLQFTDRHEIGGMAPCNRWSARMDIPYPWWGTGPVISTRRACPDLASETAFFAALEQASLSAVRDGNLILYAEDGSPLLIFKPAG